ncbi:hypothetical protein [Rheinheimera baltica]|uniref:hypothetical protein n=1 Tax=Rheinheimera baltica TaxID=67576 RepID=UPI000488FD02|nr:hypothetical protein [Rheinheimera baltica]
MNSLRINSINIVQSGFLNGLPAADFVAALSSKLIALTEAVTSTRPQTAFSHYICSSTLDIVCSGAWFEPAELSQVVATGTGISCTYSNAMQCATWGFLVRQHLLHKPDVKHILLTIVDANPLQMRFWEDNVSWGKTSHRITQVHLELPDQPAALLTDVEAIRIGKCNPTVMLYEYAGEIQKAALRHPERTIALCFFEGKMRKGLKRTLAEFPYLPDLYDEYGHVCGSDPWISIARDPQRQQGESKHYLLSSIASEGYFCFLNASLNAQSHIHIEECQVL